MPHEPGLSPVPPSEFSCIALADPISSLLPQFPNHSPLVNGCACLTQGNPQSIDSKALNNHRAPAAGVLGSAPDNEHFVPFHNSENASPAQLLPSNKPGWAEKTRNVYRSASRLVLQVLYQTT